MGNDWEPFITIKTFGYEQWLGSEADNLCKRPAITWLPSTDLAAALQAELDKQE